MHIMSQQARRPSLFAIDFDNLSTLAKLLTHRALFTLQHGAARRVTAVGGYQAINLPRMPILIVAIIASPS